MDEARYLHWWRFPPFEPGAIALYVIFDHSSKRYGYGVFDGQDNLLEFRVGFTSLQDANVRAMLAAERLSPGFQDEWVALRDRGEAVDMDGRLIPPRCTP